MNPPLPLPQSLYWKLLQAGYIKQARMSSDWTSRPSKHLSNIQPLLLETYYKHHLTVLSDVLLYGMHSYDTHQRT